MAVLAMSSSYMAWSFLLCRRELSWSHTIDASVSSVSRSSAVSFGRGAVSMMQRVPSVCPLGALNGHPA